MGDITAGIFYGAQISGEQFNKFAELLYDDYDGEEHISDCDKKDENHPLELRHDYDSDERFLIVAKSYQETDNETMFLGLNINGHGNEGWMLQIITFLNKNGVDSRKIKKVGWFLQPSYN